jgi:hypothetical protein
VTDDPLAIDVEQRSQNSTTDIPKQQSIMKSIFHIISVFLVSLVFSTNGFTVAQTFNGNSKLMLDKVLEGSPFVFRNKIRSKILNELGNGNVTEEDLLEAIKNTTPSMFLSRALDMAKRYQSQHQAR